VVVRPQLLPAVDHELRALLVQLADQVQHLLDEEAGVADAGLPAKN
jgi:hypothetical protein